MLKLLVATFPPPIYIAPPSPLSATFDPNALPFEK
jgi:hypothetical protein